MAQTVWTQIKGIDEVLKNINKAVGAIKISSKQGLIDACLLVIHEAKIQTPVDTGNLIGSWYGPIIVPVGLDHIAGIIGATASYAEAVHEMVGANFTGPRPSAKTPTRRAGGKPTAKAKFLEDPLKENTPMILELIGINVKRTIK